MAGLLNFMLLFLAMAGYSSATWCICRDGMSDSALQKTLDYACGAGADCNPTHQNGPCFNPNTVRAHCSYAVNSYFQRNRQAPTACDFSGTAVIINSDPSAAGCTYPATASATSVTPVGGSPLITTSPNGVLGGTNNGLGPSGFDTNAARGGKTRLRKRIVMLAFSGLVFLWG
ncbi:PLASMODESMATA CALLOSE-BINDING protein 3 [Dorcoceras hygrometricum]|uniref:PLASMODESMATA CALLOSE-BINDING protein 3 n=1 Tax=Dorcoceras hygrometricum TaxID=472368 RepID=A0A2Z7CHP5_9LAMI|nr:PLASMODESMATA CALLOSE-BINDING protein 3 [Dorcoceras hygrometricum]